MPHVLVLESEDGTIVQSRSLSADARARDLGFVECIPRPPRCTAIDSGARMLEPSVVFDWTPYEALSSLGPETFLDSTQSWGAEPPGGDS